MIKQKKLFFVIISLILLVFNAYSQIINLSNNDYDSEQPFLLKNDDSEYVFWVDNLGEEQGLSYRYFVSDNWSESYYYPIAGNIDINDILINDSGIFILFDQIIDNENLLMIGLINDSNEFEYFEVTSYLTVLINSGSLIIDDTDYIHIVWETYIYSEPVRVYYSTTDEISNWGEIELLYENEYQAVYSYPQLIKSNNEIVNCFWLSRMIDETIYHAQRSVDGVWQAYTQIPYVGLGEKFVVKKDLTDIIHFVSNQTLLTTWHNDLYYFNLDDGEWSDLELVPYWTHPNSPLNERWNPDMSFMDDNSVFISWEHYAFSEGFYPCGNWIGSTIEVSEGWFENAPFAYNREPNNPDLLIIDDLVHYVWSDSSDGDFDIYYSVTEPYVNSNEYSLMLNSDLSLSNYPNPFNPTTMIEFSIPNDSSIEINIYNSKGQKINTLINEDLIQGQYTVYWEGNNYLGDSVSSGVYLYSLKVNGRQVSLKKCLLLK
ncbi:MAG: hypothetical protein APR54_08990 [Candidatus Cloacimonas sp. SDB]|nr:MAG: hypothetical protein APR54_08990 [Candidatus Cloacimonas sp. SDB]